MLRGPRLKPTPPVTCQPLSSRLLMPPTSGLKPPPTLIETSRSDCAEAQMPARQMNPTSNPQQRAVNLFIFVPETPAGNRCLLGVVVALRRRETNVADQQP